jgi:HAD superfamily hydrolase (TIGR01549 family)
MIRAVLFDADDCLVDQTRHWGDWAEWIGVPRHTFSAQFGALVALGRDPMLAFEIFSPGFDMERERQKREITGNPEWFGEHDLYPDVRVTIKLLRDAGLMLGIAANESEKATVRLHRLFSHYIQLLATSARMGLAKPDPRFFEPLIEALKMEPHEILYVGDRLDEDIEPAAKAGLLTALAPRGPWGIIHQHHPELDSLTTFRIRHLRDLPNKIAEYNEEHG